MPDARLRVRAYNFRRGAGGGFFRCNRFPLWAASMAPARAPSASRDTLLAEGSGPTLLGAVSGEGLVEESPDPPAAHAPLRPASFLPPTERPCRRSRRAALLCSLAAVGRRERTSDHTCLCCSHGLSHRVRGGMTLRMSQREIDVSETSLARSMHNVVRVQLPWTRRERDQGRGG
jgi:hypothetical protein